MREGKEEEEVENEGTEGRTAGWEHEEAKKRREKEEGKEGQGEEEPWRREEEEGIGVPGGAGLCLQQVQARLTWKGGVWKLANPRPDLRKAVNSCRPRYGEIFSTGATCKHAEQIFKHLIEIAKEGYPRVPSACGKC